MSQEATLLFPSKRLFADPTSTPTTQLPRIVHFILVTYTYDYTKSTMPPRSNGQRHDFRASESLETAEREKELPAKWRLRTFLALLVFDSICSTILLTPLFPRYVVNDTVSRLI